MPWLLVASVGALIREVATEVAHREDGRQDRLGSRPVSGSSQTSGEAVAAIQGRGDEVRTGTGWWLWEWRGVAVAGLCGGGGRGDRTKD